MSRHTDMQTRMAVASSAVLAALIGWWARGVEWNASGGEVVHPLASRAEIVVASDANAKIGFAVDHHIATPRDSRGNRNLFAYREAAPVIERVAYTAPPLVVAQPEVATTPVVEVKPQRRVFTARYIGRFGHDREPIAAFSRDGEVMIVREGERIDEHFVLRRIGLESVEVETREEDGEVTTQRVHFFGSI